MLFFGRIIVCFFLFSVSALQAEVLSYTVKKNDSLYGISREFGVPTQWIIRKNNLSGNQILAGMKLTIPVNGISSLRVRSGDTLSEISLEFDVSEDELRRINNLESDNLKVGQKLNIPSPLPPDSYRVQPGDTLLGIAKTYKISPEQLRVYNSLENDVIHPGKILKVNPPSPKIYQIAKGDSLWTIAKRFNLSPSRIREWNAIENQDAIFPGQKLKLYTDINPAPRVELARISQTPPKTPSSAVLKKNNLPRLGEYFFSRPKASSQLSVLYIENSNEDVPSDYKKAVQIMDEFRKETAAMPPLGTVLEGWLVVIDPGHGGLDPGAIVANTDGAGKEIIITEDEYVYDIAMRLFRVLSRYGASVYSTILASDHHIRNGDNPRQTFVNRKNEVYNSKDHNRSQGWRPVGTRAGLELRKNIAKSIIHAADESEKNKGTLFICLHADNSADLPSGRAVLFGGINADEKDGSRRLAKTLSRRLGAGAFTKEQSLRVLQGNPAENAVLVEVRNLYYKRNAWAIRSPNLREQDAWMIANGILDWAEKSDSRN